MDARLLRSVAIPISWVTVVIGGSQAGAQVTRTLVEELRIGGADTGATSFSHVTALAVTPGGHLFVADFAGGPQIKVFDAAGRFVANAGRSGGGPGEYRFVSAMIRGPDGLIHVVDTYGMRVLMFGERGELVSQRSVQFTTLNRVWQGAILIDGTMLDPVFGGPRSGVPVSEPRPAARLRRIRPDGTIADTIAGPDCQLARAPRERSIQLQQGSRRTVVQIPFVPVPQTVYAPDGTAWCAPRDTYLVHHLRVGRNDTLITIKRDAPALPIPRDSLDKVIAGFTRAAARASRSNFSPDLIPRYQPVLAAIAVDDQGKLLVRRTDTPPLAPFFDLFDGDGTALGTIQGKGRIVGIPLIVANRAYAVVLDEDDVPFVVRAAIR